MKVVVLGGHDRLKVHVSNIARRYGLQIEFINKETQNNIDSALACADWVLVFTSLVGHNMVKLAKRYAGERCIFCKGHGVCALEREIKKLMDRYEEDHIDT